jgi:alpha-glucosidase
MTRLFSLSLMVLLILSSCYHNKNIELLSPDNNIKVIVSRGTDGRLLYQIFQGDQLVIEPSGLGVKTSLADFTDKLTITKVSNVIRVSDNYITPTEKRYNNTYLANEKQITIENGDRHQLKVIFRVSNDGVAFRYHFPQVDKSGSLTILSEHTTFKIPEKSRAWLHPHANVKEGWCQTQPSYEENYHINIPVGTPAPLVAGWSFPALFKIGEKWALISESGLEPPYCGSRLSQNSPKGEYAIGFPQVGETIDTSDVITPVGSSPFYSPWRTIVIGQLPTIVESNLITALAAPSKIEDTSKFKPGISSWSWGVLKDESVNYNTQKEFIDYAAQMGWSYCLVDVNWDTQIGYDKIQELIDYAKTKNVGIILWYNSSGDWNSTVYSPKSKLVNASMRNAEFERISKMGVKGVKVDFWPGDGPSAIQYYYDMMTDAAHHGLMVNFHGTTVARGWSRTFPNLVSMEAVKGFEFTTFEQKNNDTNSVHCTILPFTRNAVGHMDYTPVCFDEIPGIIRRTSNAFELALSVVFQSGIQHFVTTPQSMKQQPDYVVGFMKNLPVRWDDVKLIDGFPGKYVVIARKYANRWYVAGINAQSEIIHLTLDLSSFNPPKSVEVITDGENNRSFNKKPMNLEQQSLHIEIAPHGGFVLAM